jgi:uncharacterized protein (DUF983 family)
MRLNSMKLVTSKTRAGKNGKTLTCPHCYNTILVYDFKFRLISCGKCKEKVQRWDFIINFKTRIVLFEKYYSNKILL